MTDEEKKELEFAHDVAQQAICRYFEESRKVSALNKKIVELEEKADKEFEKKIKAVKFEIEKQTVELVCEAVDGAIGFHAYECTDRIRKTYKIPTKYGY